MPLSDAGIPGGNGGKRELPPLILHPFETRAVSGGEPEGEIRSEEDRKYLQSRYAELRMLCFLGKDLQRWLGQCVEVAAAERDLAGASEASFIQLLLFSPPLGVVRKMKQWGVGNYQLVFSRALGLNALFCDPPAITAVSAAFLRNFHLYADAAFDTRLKLEPGRELHGDDFEIPVYASGEYARLLERSWSMAG